MSTTATIPAEMIAALTAAGHAIATSVWIAELQLEDGRRTVSVHTAEDRAEAALATRAQRAGAVVASRSVTFVEVP